MCKDHMFKMACIIYVYKSYTGFLKGNMGHLRTL